MTQGTGVADPVPLSNVRSADLDRPGFAFFDGDMEYRTTGEHVGNGGMGNAFVLERRLRPLAGGTAQPAAVGKIFHSEYLYQLRTDEVTRRDHDAVLCSLIDISRIEHENLLPIQLSAAIADNHLTVTPRKAATLLQAVATGRISPRQRIALLIQALRGLSALHHAGFVHRDFTLRNMLVDDRSQTAYLFDFDLALKLSEVAGESYKARYQGRIFGSPGYSVAPEVLDAQLMDQPIGTALDIYAVGGAIFALFTDQLPYGPTEDMWSLLLRITDGVVFGGKSRIVYPEAVPAPLRPVVEACMERDPEKRTASADAVIAELEAVLPELEGSQGPESDGAGTTDHDSAATNRWGSPTAPSLIQRTFRYGDPRARLSAVYASRRDLSVEFDLVQEIDQALGRQGYLLQRSMGKVKDHPIFMAAPNPELVAQGQFPDANLYPKIVTALSLRGPGDPGALVEKWMGHYLPVLRAARQGLLTSLYRVVHDEPSQMLLLFSEYVDDARFGPVLDEHELTLEEAFGLGYLVARQVWRLHTRGMAHNNVSAGALLLKGLRDIRRVHPAMVGIVAPSLDPDDMFEDVARLAELLLSWLRIERIHQAEAAHRARLGDVQHRLVDLATARRGIEWARGDATIDDLIDVVADGLSAIDFNFGVLRESGGDLEAYALLLVSHALYGRLWTS